MATDESAVFLDTEQHEVATASVSARLIVSAPPGSGKTEVVAARLQYLVEDAGLEPASELLVISFSRAAVSAVRRRAASGPGMAGLSVSTIDSLAARILDDKDVNDWQALSFDARVERARGLVVAAGELPNELADLRHIIVDEVQDVVGVRAQLVLEILRLLPLDVGFTLLGDSAQGVYNFQLHGDASGMTSSDFLTATRAGCSVGQVQLHGQYRARSADTRRAAELSRAGDRATGLRNLVASLPSAGSCSGLAGILRRWQGTTAVLCRTNGEVLVTARALWQSGLPATIRAVAEELPLAPWIAASIGDLSGSSLPKDAVIGALNAMNLDAERLWRLLKSTERDRRAPDRLAVGRLAARLAAGAVPVELRADAGPIVVSTIHRAKGLEFDNVVLINRDRLLPAHADEEDAAVAYVAATRARDRIAVATCELPPFLLKDRDRWLVSGHQKWMTSSFELRGIDCVGADCAIGPDTAVGAPGRAIINPARSDLIRPVYDLLVNGSLVGRTSEQFGELLASRLRGPRRKGRPWPDIDGLAVESLATYVDARPGAQRSFSLGARLAGLGHLNWDGVK